MLRHNAHKTFSPKCVIDREDFTQEDRSMCRRVGSGREGDGLGRQVISCTQCHGGEGHCGCAPAGGAAAFRDGGGCLLEVVPLSIALAPQASRQAGGPALNAAPASGAMDGGCCSALLTNAGKLIMERLTRQVIGTSEQLDRKHSDSYFCENVPFTFWTGGTRTRGRLSAMSTLLCRLWRRRAVCAAGWVYVMQQMDGLLTSFLGINLLMTCSMEETRPSLG